LSKSFLLLFFKKEDLPAFQPIALRAEPGLVDVL
jgi:hypothetical protein